MLVCNSILLFIAKVDSLHSESIAFLALTQTKLKVGYYARPSSYNTLRENIFADSNKRAFKFYMTYGKVMSKHFIVACCLGKKDWLNKLSDYCYKDDFGLRFICKTLHDMTSRMQSAFLFCITA